jgi:hypothetical protein
MRRVRLAGIALAALVAVFTVVGWVSGWFTSPSSPDAAMVPSWLFISPCVLLLACGVLAIGEAVIRRQRGAADEDWHGAHLVKKELVASWLISAQRTISGSSRLSRVPIEFAAGAVLVVVVASALIIASTGMRVSIRAASHRSIALAWARSITDSVAATPWRTQDALVYATTLFADPGSTDALQLIGDRRLEPAVRIRLAQMTAAGFCENPREVLFGIAPSRADLLGRATEKLSDLDGMLVSMDPWRTWLTTAISTGVTPPMGSTAFAGDAKGKSAVTFATTLFRLRGLRSRLAYCSLG